jgi:hypothetical protein
MPVGVSKTILPLIVAEGGDITDISWNPENDCPITGVDFDKVSLNLCRQYRRTFCLMPLVSQKSDTD